MIKTIGLKLNRNRISSLKSKIYGSIITRKRLNTEYDKYVYNAIMEAEESLANGEKTYTLDEWKTITKEWDEKDG